jgi:hypothetical protein
VFIIARFPRPSLGVILYIKILADGCVEFAPGFSDRPVISLLEVATYWGQEFGY